MRSTRCSPPDRAPIVSSLIRDGSSHHVPGWSLGWIHGWPGVANRPATNPTSNSTAASSGYSPFAQVRSPA